MKKYIDIKRIGAFRIFLKKGKAEAERLYPEYKEMFNIYKDRTFKEFLKIQSIS